MESLNKFFVYGTLMPMQVNFIRIERFVESSVEATLNDYTLYTFHIGSFPIAVPHRGEAVKGMVLTVKPEFVKAVLVILDRLEGVPTFYQRKVVRTSAGFAYMYRMASPPKGAIRIGSAWKEN